MDTERPKAIYRILFQHQGECCELFAVRVAQGHLPAFIELEQLVFAERAAGSATQERLRHTLAEVKRSYIPLHAVVRIDEVERSAVECEPRTNIAPLRIGTPRA